jgi:sugar lactone lactonase YvrE
MHTTNRILTAAAVVGALAGCGSSSQPSTNEDAGSPIADGGVPIVDGGPPIVDGGPPIVDAPPFTRGVSTLAGSAAVGFTDGDRNVARFDNPVNVAYGSDGRVYVADFYNNKIRAVDASGNVTTIVAQSGFMRPFGLALARDGTLFVSTDNDKNGAHDLMSGSVWRVDLHSGAATIVANAIGRPRGIAILGDGRLALSDNLHHVVRLLDPRTGVIADLAGSWDATGYVDAAGAAARFSTPYGIAVRHDGRLVVVDQGNGRLRLVGLDGSVTTLAGAAPGYGDGPRTQARFDHPQAIVVATDDSIYVTDDNNFRVRKLDGDSVTTVVGNGTAGYKDADDLLAAEVYGIEGLALSTDGKTLYLADGNRGDPLPYNRIRIVNLTH